MDDREREWRFDIEDVGDNEADTEANTETETETETDIMKLRSADPEPGSPSIENVAFVVFGAIVTVAALLIYLGII